MLMETESPARRQLHGHDVNGSFGEAGWPCPHPRATPVTSPWTCGNVPEVQPPAPCSFAEGPPLGEGGREESEAPSRVNDKTQLQGWKLSAADTQPRPQKARNPPRALWRGSGVGLGSAGGWVESSLVGHTSLAQAPAPLAQGLVISPAWPPGWGRKPEDLLSALGDR